MRAIVTGQVGVDKGPYLEAVKAAAVKEERYEEAARLRDEIEKQKPV